MVFCDRLTWMMSITLMWHLMVLMKWMHLWTLLRSPKFHLVAHFSLQNLCSYVPNTISSYLLEDFALTTVALTGWRSCTHHGEGSCQLHIRRALLGLFYLKILHCMLDQIAASWWFTEKGDLRNWRQMTWRESLCVGGGLNCKTMCYSHWPNQSGSRAGSNIPTPGKEWHCTLYFVSKFGVFCSLAPPYYILWTWLWFLLGEQVEVLPFALSPVLRALVGLGGGNNTSLDLLSLQYLVLLLLLGPAELKPVGSHVSFHHRFPC
jgi:hypothetical protein